MHASFFAHVQLSKYRAVLCLDGELPDKAFFDHITDFGLPIFAADGAANRLDNLPLRLVIGDLDSMRPELFGKFPVLQDSSQDCNDFQKSLTWLEEKELLPAIIVGVGGGYLDHVLSNISILTGGSGSICYAPPLITYVLSGTHDLCLPLNTKVSLFGAPNALVTTKGLKWELCDMGLSFPIRSSCFNRTTNELIRIVVHSGVLLAMVYLHPVVDAGCQQ